MKRNRSRVLGLLLAAAMCASLLAVVPASAAGSAPVIWSDTIGSSSAKLVTVVMGPGRTGEIALANNSVVSAAPAATVIAQKNAQANTSVVAAVNGGFFDSYSGHPAVMNGIVINNKLIHTGKTASIGFTANGTPMIDWVDFTGTEVRLGNGYVVNVGKSVNTYESAPESIMLFNDYMTEAVAIPAASTIVLIKGGKVTAIGAGGYSMTVPADTDVLVYNSAAAALYKEWGQFPEVGMSAKIILKASGTDRDAAWSSVESALVGGPVLVKNGVNVTNDNRNQEFYGDPKQRPGYVASRSFIAITNDNMLVMGTANTSMNNIANWVVSKGWKEAIAMDGGASTMLYANGSFLTPAGRNLATVLTIVDRTGAGGLPAESNVGDPTTDTPDAWAMGDLTSAINLGLVPENLRKGYKDDITRQDFCVLIWELVSKHPNIINLLYTKPEVTGFTDITNQTTNGQKVAWVAQLGIVNGYTDGSFKPYNTLSRAEAAKILALTVQLLGGQDTGEQYPFTDRTAFAGWAEEYVDFCGVNGILKGTGGGAFDPTGRFTRQQAITTMLRIYNSYLA